MRLGILRRIRPILTIHAPLDLYKAMVQPVMTYCSIALLFMSETNRKTFDKLEKRASKIIIGEYHQEGHMFRSHTNKQNIQCVDFILRCLNKTAPEVFHNYFEKVERQKTTRVKGRNLKISKKN